MARPVDQRRQQERRLQIIDAAFTCFASNGFDRTTTASICRAAGIGSGTFFHYYPTKVDVLLAILALGADETAEVLRTQTGHAEPVDALLAYVAHEAENLQDPRAAGFVRAVGAATSDARIAAALESGRRATETVLTTWIEQAQQRRAVRTDLTAARTVRWVLALIDGFAAQVAGGDAFDARHESGILLDTVRRFLAPDTGTDNGTDH